MTDLYVYICGECGRPISLVSKPVYVMCCHKEVKTFELMSEKKALKIYKEWEKASLKEKKPERKRAKK